MYFGFCEFSRLLTLATASFLLFVLLKLESVDLI